MSEAGQRAAVGLVILAVTLGVVACGRNAGESSAARESQVRVTMRDGVELAGDLYLPAGSGRFPTLVRKTPYERPPHSEEGQFYAGHGYALLIVSQRGRFESGGVFHQARNEGWLEHQDGYDTIEWAAAQPWSNGNIGTFGISSDGQWQMAAAPTQPPHLKAMFTSYPAHHRNGGRIERGIHTSTGPTWHHNNNAMPRPLRKREDWQQWLGDWKKSGLPLLASFIHPELVEQFVHTAYDDYWRDIDPGTRYADFAVPVYHESGWYDRYVRYTFQSFNGIRNQSRSELARRSQKVIMGPWVHGGNVAPETETVKFGPAAKVDRRALHLRWFDHWLKGVDTGIMKEPPVRVYLMGAERWLESDTWPLPNTQSVTYFLRASGPARSGESLNDGRLLQEKPASEPPDEYVHDPYDPIPTIGGHGGFGGIWPPGPLDQRPAEKRTLTFTTEALAEDMEVVGEVRARFFASSSNVDTDFVLTLTDVYPNGYSTFLRQNAVRGRYRETDEKESLLTPHRVYEFQLTLDGVANLFKAGHRLRLSIASSSFPAFLPNPGTAAPMHLETEGRTARNRIHHDREYPSSIEVPVRK